MGSRQDQGGGLGQAGPGRAGGGSPPFAASLTTALLLLQIFPLSPGPRWQGSSARPVALALQQALGQGLARGCEGSPAVPGSRLTSRGHSGMLLAGSGDQGLATSPQPGCESREVRGSWREDILRVRFAFYGC